MEEIIVFFVCFTTLHFEKRFTQDVKWQYEGRAIFFSQLSPQFSIGKQWDMYVQDVIASEI